MTGTQSYRSRLILFADYFFGPPTFVYQTFNSLLLLPRIFQILDTVDSVIEVHGTSSQRERNICMNAYFTLDSLSARM